MGRKRWIYTDGGKPLPEPIEVEVDGPVRPSSPETGFGAFENEQPKPKPAIPQVGGWSDYEE